jgi:hypothetical protein
MSLAHAGRSRWRIPTRTSATTSSRSPSSSSRTIHLAVQPKQDERLTFTLVTDGVHSAIEQAKAGAQNVDPARVQLAKIGVQEVGPRTSLRFRVVSQA